MQNSITPCVDAAKHFETREEWLLWRKGGVGSSDAAAIMGESPWATPFELFLEKTGRIAGRRRSPWEWKAMQRGIRLEPEARESYESWHRILMPSAPLIHPLYPQLRASLDGLNREAQRALEIKCPGEADHKVAVGGKIPKKYRLQCAHILMVSGMPRLDYFSYRDEKGVTIAMERERTLESSLMERELEFWECVQRDRWPPPRFFVPSNVLFFRR